MTLNMVHMLQVTLQMTIALITWHQTTSALLQGYRCGQCVALVQCA